MNEGKQVFVTPQSIYIDVCVCVYLYNTIHIYYSGTLNLVFKWTIYTVKSRHSTIQQNMKVMAKIPFVPFSLATTSSAFLDTVSKGIYYVSCWGSIVFFTLVFSMLLHRINITLLRLSNIALCIYTKFSFDSHLLTDS